MALPVNDSLPACATGGCEAQRGKEEKSKK